MTTAAPARPCAAEPTLRRQLAAMSNDEGIAYRRRMAFAAKIIASTVRDEGPEAVAEAVAAALDIPPPPGVDPVVAMASALVCEQAAPPSRPVPRPAHRPVGQPADYGQPRRPAPARPHSDGTTRVARPRRDSAAHLTFTAAVAQVRAVVDGRGSVLELPLPLRPIAIRVLRRRGLSYPQIAFVARCSRNAVLKYLRKRQLIRRRGPAANLTFAEAVTLVRAVVAGRRSVLEVPLPLRPIAIRILKRRGLTHEEAGHVGRCSKQAVSSYLLRKTPARGEPRRRREATRAAA